MNTSPGLTPDPLPDHITDELSRLRAKVKELEEAMPSAERLGIIAGYFAYYKNLKAAKELMDMADRIEKVMKGLQPIRASNESLISRETNDKIGSEFLANLSANPK